MGRLELNDPGWARLSHAYGRAEDLPELLARLPDAPPMRPDDEDAWYCAWSALCHQFSVYTASYAAVPHLIEMAGRTSGTRRLDFLSLAGSIETFRHLPGAPAFPPGLEAPYCDALHTAKSLALEALGEEWPEPSFRELLGIVAALGGHPRLGAGILLGSAEYSCGQCGATETLPGYVEFDPLQAG
jgi:hypothetical protein